MRERELKAELDTWSVGTLWPEMLGSIAARRERAIVRLVQASKDGKLDAYSGAEVDVLNWVSTLPDLLVQQAGMGEAQHQVDQNAVDDDGF